MSDYPGSCVFPLNVNVIEASERVTDIVTNRPIQQIADRTTYLKSKIFKQDVVTIKNQFVYQGFYLTVGTGRNFNLTFVSDGDGSEAGLSRAYMDGHDVAFPSVANKVAVPTNVGATPVTYYVYLDADGDGIYDVGISQALPDGALLLYTVTVPAGHTGSNLTNVTKVRNCVTEPLAGFCRASALSGSVTLADVPDLDSEDGYQVVLEVLTALPGGAIGPLFVGNKTTTGFTIYHYGSADFLNVRYTILLFPAEV